MTRKRKEQEEGVQDKDQEVDASDFPCTHAKGPVDESAKQYPSNESVVCLLRIH